MLARQGLTGSLDVLDGESGLGRAMAEGPDWSGIGATLGRDFHIQRLTFKNHIGCGHTFAAIDGALALRQRHGLAAADITEVRVATYQPALDIAGHASPATASEARFSFPFVVASALVHGSVRLAAYEPARLRDPDIRALMERVTVVVDPDIDRGFPARRAARVEIAMADGRRYTHLQTHRKGDPEEPLTDQELHDKFLELSAPVIGAGAASTLLARLRSAGRATALDW